MKSFRERNPLVLGAVGSVVLAAVLTATFNFDNLPIVGSGTTYSADFSEAAGLQSSDEVRIAGIKVGEVASVDLDVDHVLVKFKVKDAWVGDKTSVQIKIKTLLGRKFLSLSPLGDTDQDPRRTIPLTRTITPYDVTEAFNGLADTVGAIDTNQLAESFRAISDTFKNSPAQIRTALDGLTSLSKTISSRDNELADLLTNAHKITGTLAASDGDFDKLINDGNQLLTELANRRDSIHLLLVGARNLGTQLTGLVHDNQAALNPALADLNAVTGILKQQNDNLDKSLQLAGPYFRVLNNSAGNGRWVDSYLCGLLPDNRKSCTPPKTIGSPG